MAKSVSNRPEARAAANDGERVPSLASVLTGPPYGDDHTWRRPASTSPDLPILTLHCDKCDGSRHFAGYWLKGTPDAPALLAYPAVQAEMSATRTAIYTCKNCSSLTVRMVLRFVPETASTGSSAIITKIGQHPPYRPRIPRRVQRFITGQDWDLYIKARTAESLGLGIAAVTYYRRVVEDSRAKLLERLIAVAEETGEGGLVDDLQRAANNWQFSSSMDQIAPAVPQRLLIGGHNPLTLLHRAFSDGVHNRTDAECLERAVAGRQVLEELLESMAAVLQDRAELISAVSKLADPSPPSKFDRE